jgi:hypothetical protein
MKLTDKQLKALWIAGGVLTVVHFVPNVVNAVRQQSAAYRYAHAKPSPAIPAAARVSPTPAAPPAPAAPSVPPEVAALSKLVGIWGATIPRPNLGMCDIRLELKPGEDKPGFIGYSTISCANLFRFRPGQTTNTNNVGDWMLDAKPVSAILRGEIKNDSIEFVQEKAVGTNRSGCNITEISASPFTEFMAITWKEGPASSCGGGDVVMHRLKTF